MTFATLYQGQPGPDIEAKDLKEAIFLRDTFLPGYEILSSVSSEDVEFDEDTHIPSEEN